jgi:hypothetical protein
MKQWPENDQPAPFEDLVKEIFEAVRFAYNFERKNEGIDIPLVGPDAPPTIFNPSGSECLKVKWLGASTDDQIRTPMEIIIGVAIRLGAEQERRSGKQERSQYFDSAKCSLEALTSLANSLKDGDARAFPSIKSSIGFLERDLNKLAS